MNVPGPTVELVENVEVVPRSSNEPHYTYSRTGKLAERLHGKHKSWRSI